MELHLEELEASLLLKILRNRLNELIVEIRHNKGSEARDYLKHKKRILTGIIDQFPEIDERAHMRGYVKAA
jgi:hypothetical protein